MCPVIQWQLFVHFFDPKLSLFFFVFLCIHFPNFAFCLFNQRIMYLKQVLFDTNKYDFCDRSMTAMIFMFSGFFLFFDYLLCYNLSVLFYQNIISAMNFMFCFVGLFYAFYFICAFCHIILLLDVNLLLFYHCLFLFTWPTLWVYDSRFLSVSKRWPKDSVTSSESVSPMKEIGNRCERTISKVFKHAIFN